MLPGPLIGISTAAKAVVLLVATFWIAYLLAGRLVPRASGASRWAATAIVGYAYLYGAFSLLLALHQYTLWAALAVTVVPAVTLHRLLGGPRAFASFRSDLQRVREVLSRLARSPWIVAVVAVAGLGGIRLVRGMVLPPMGWDALTYHLYKAGRWVQLGRNVVLPAPDSWGYYEYFPSAGDSYWAWALLVAPDGALLAAAGGLVWATLAVGTFAAARRWGASVEPASAAALAVVSTPAVMSALTASNVDNTLAALFVLAVPFLTPGSGSGKGNPAGEGALAGLALGLGAAVKTSLVPVAVATVTLATILAFKGPERRRRTAWLGAFFLPLLLVLGVEYGPTWVRTGSPTYPVPLRVAGVEIAAGNEELDILMRGELPGYEVGGSQGFRTLPWLFGIRRGVRSDHAGLGPAGIVLPIMALLGMAVAVRDPSRRTPVALSLASAVSLVVVAYAPGAVALWGLWPETFARHLVPAFSALVIAASLAYGRVAKTFWAIFLGMNIWLSLPHGWGPIDTWATIVVAAWLAAGAVVGAMVARVLRVAAIRPGPRFAIAMIVALFVASAPLPGLRMDHRYEIWESAARPDGAYDYQGLAVLSAGAWRIWERLDRESGVRIAVASGWNGLGQVWYLYPLLGSSLQNRVTYVPPTVDGEVIDYRDWERLAAHANRRAWIGRLLEENIDFVVTMRPSPPERLNWIVRLPEVFEREIGDDRTDNYLYRFDREAATRFLQTR
jgi:hypothetical protein